MKERALQWDVVSARDAVAPAVYTDLATDVTVVDVSAWGEAIDMAQVAAVGDPILVCFGTHGDDLCPLDDTGRGWPGDHGVVFDTVAGRQGDEDFVARFRELVRPNVPIRTRARRGGGQQLETVKET